MRGGLGVLFAASLVVMPVSGDMSGLVRRDDTVAVVLLLDLSASMQGRVPEDSTDAVETVTDAFLAALAPGDRAWFGRVAGTAAFSGMFELASTYLDQQVRVFRMTAAERYGSSPLWDALDGAVRRLEGQSGPRAVIVWTDGRATGNRVGLHEVAARARAAGVSINVASVPTDEFIPQTPTTAVRVRPSLYLQSMADVTGGVLLSVQDVTGVVWLVRDVMDRLHEPVGGRTGVLR